MSDHIFPRPEVPLLERPLAERRRIVLAPASHIAALNAADRLHGPGVTMKEALKRLDGFSEPTLEAADKLRHQTFKMAQSHRDVVLVSPSLSRSLEFFDTAPEFQEVFLSHPRKAGCYLSSGKYHTYLKQQKLGEAIMLAQDLGACSLQVKGIETAKVETGWGFTVSLPKIGNLHLGGPKTSTLTEQTTFRGVYRKRRRAVVPTGLLWYEAEPTWQAVAEGRLKHRLDEFALAVVLREGVDAKLEAAALGAGLQFEKARSDVFETALIVHGQFHRSLWSRRLRTVGQAPAASPATET